MEYRYLGGSGFKVPALGFGTGTFGGKGPLFSAWGRTGVEEARRLIDICLDAGITLFDTADVYSDGRVEQRDACFQADVDEPPRFLHAGLAPRGEQRPLAAERARTEAEHRHPETGSAEITIFHVLHLSFARDVMMCRLRPLTAAKHRPGAESVSAFP